LELQFSIDVDPQVTFLYPSRPNHTILKGLNLTIPARKLTCIMGPSGCGKSTVMSLLMRLYEPLTGSITLDGVDISRLDIVFLRSLIGLVQQEPVRPLVCCRSYFLCFFFVSDFVFVELEGQPYLWETGRN
jgi:ABC-type bacteriocin/lantibiotic exporter with double-glycine peptidase domain